ncbi:lmo0954 family membrane protein [Sporosarcina aquimarina]|uniref:ABC transporter permease n=1 Tax=Sporosarcina aquimarina TaxID=114975 RepID=A0ABU4FUX4_9BACL|nr:ABC transporter permease [Sporosarcina aquimarina]MDW0108507.1 ABC transporter permease [Sporosarcina aquimarina]
MKKFALVVLGIIAGIVAVANIGSIVALALSAAAAFAGWHYFRKSDSTIGRILWGIVLLFGILTGISNIPAFIGILAAAGAYYAWHSWKVSKRKNSNVIDADPFAKFEKQWNEFTK